MGSISGFKEYVDKDHPACPLCGGATNKAEYPQIHDIRQLLVQECVNCGAQHDKEAGQIVREAN